MSDEVADLFLKLDTLNDYASRPANSAKEMRRKWDVTASASAWTLYRNGDRRMPEGMLRDLTAAALRQLPGGALAVLDSDSDASPLHLPFPEFWRRIDATAAAAASEEELARARLRTWQRVRAALLVPGNGPPAPGGASARDIEGPENGERWIDLATSPDVRDHGLVLPANGSFTLSLPACGAGPHWLWIFEMRDLGRSIVRDGPPGTDLVRWARSPMTVAAEGSGPEARIELRRVQVSNECGHYIAVVISAPVGTEVRFDPQTGGEPRERSFSDTVRMMRILRTIIAGHRHDGEPRAGSIAANFLRYAVR
jgi:hypothetical protein